MPIPWASGVICGIASRNTRTQADYDFAAARVRAAFLLLSCFFSLSLPSVCFRLDKPCSARSHLFCPKRAAARPVDCENKRLHSAPRGNTTGGGSNDNICTMGVSLSTLFLVPDYIGDTSRNSPVWEILKKESFVFPRSIHESFCLDGSNILLQCMGMFYEVPFIFSTLMGFTIPLKLIFSNLINAMFIS